MAETITTDLLVIGAGPAGYTAAIYAARANLSPVLVAGLQPGGQLTITTEVENYPGFATAIQGPWLMEQMAEQAQNVGTRIEYDIITSVDFKAGSPFRLTGDSGTIYKARSVIVATGAQARWLGLPSEKRLQGAGVSACATCDGFFYRGKNVVVVGGGNTAVEEALYLTHHAAHVTLVHDAIACGLKRFCKTDFLPTPRFPLSGTVLWKIFWPMAHQKQCAVYG